MAPPVGSVPKYIKVNGVMQKNPAHPENRVGAVPAKMAAPANALTPICTMNDIANQNACGGAQIHVSAATELALVRMQDASILSQYAPGVNCSEVVDGVGEIFARYGGRSTVRVWTARASVGRALLYTFRGLAWLRSHVALALVSGTRFP
jgi:hypothetical protein